jgi:hypothetical protein
VEPRETAVARIGDLAPSPEIFCDNYNADNKSDVLLDFSGAEGKPAVSLKQTKFFLKQFAIRMGQANYNAFSKWKTVWVAGFLKKKL